MSDATYCEGLRICTARRTRRAEGVVRGVRQGEVVRGPIGDGEVLLLRGLRHSIKLYSPRMPTDWNCRGQTDPAIQAAVKANRPIKIV